jgi:hypothetical protein
MSMHDSRLLQQQDEQAVLYSGKGAGTQWLPLQVVLFNTEHGGPKYQWR